ncbi:MAG: hypothetical protein A3G18_08650 [Rhodospirillales bacterium RIFCSPLOWO2_12_FULL_58_28]|nr:MAG: hypothetical protein A3H92_00205 [Rhodospirillales bacterium RIFCSPLOWO2_02_FULL_58_16]OHC79766.1 MAG: hypothetical protein A3G18_08650 [Rhodospirillales bacterium RIFCSPLOWO2_12_FULL_58_28]
MNAIVRLKHFIAKLPIANNIALRRNFDRMRTGYLNDVFSELEKHFTAEPLETLKKPRSSLIEVTNNCNLRCKMCGTHKATRRRGYMSEQTFERVVSQCVENGGRTGLFTVGEIFMVPEKTLDRFMEICRKYNFIPFISTNAQFPQRLKHILEEFPDVVRYVGFSIDGATENTYENIRVNGKFDRVIESLDIMRPYLKNGVDLGIRAVISLDNIHEISEIFNLGKSYINPKKISFNIVNSLAPDDIYFNNTILPYKNIYKSQAPCSLPFSDIYFTYDGQATLCCRDYEAELSIGDIHKHSLIDLFTNEKAKAIRAQHLNPHSLNIKLCSNCFGALRFVGTAFNSYIHLCMNAHRNMSGDELQSRIEKLLHDVDTAIPHGPSVIKAALLSCFSDI